MKLCLLGKYIYLQYLSLCVSWKDKHFLYHMSHKETNATKKHQYERDLIQLSFLIHNSQIKKWS